MRLKFEDIMFFIFVGLMLFVALWLLHGSPTFMVALISVVIFAAGSDMMLWRKVFQIDKNTAVGFEKVRNDMNELRKDMNFGFEGINMKLKNVEDKLINIENLIIKK